ncbi:hypothetical protein [Amycolatopsis sp. CFH S0078]|uniref:hypothetical protein n=1 Tax=Amycolatopsis sp. CFH S0078 TaxID=1644108 RepID=UPI00106E0824|nr:hypothetical protein [Amycolatopsis sp. CFH S0078]
MTSILHRRVARTLAGAILAASTALALAGCQSEPAAAPPAPVVAHVVTPAPPQAKAAPNPAPAAAPVPQTTAAPAPAQHPVVKARPRRPVVRHRPAPAPAAPKPQPQTVDLGGGWSAYCTGGYLQPNGVCTNRPDGFNPPPAPAANPCSGTGTECLNAMFGGDVQNEIPALQGGR